MSIIKKEAYFNSTDGKNKVRTLIWENDETAPVAVFQISHGVAEHIGRYDDFARFLASNGFVVCGNDHLGHGKTSPAMELLGDIDGADGDVRIVDDMHKLYKIMHKRYPELPYFMFGHSMGSFAARIYARTFGYELCGLCLCGTGQLPATAGLLTQPIEMLVNRLGEDMSFGNVFAATGKFQSLGFEGEVGDELAWLSRSKENRENYRNDPYCGFNLNAGGWEALAKLGIKACEPDWAQELPTALRVMLISGAKDPIGSNGRGVLKVADSLERVGIEPTVILYPGDRHEILNEASREIVYRDVLEWAYEAMN